jgi:AcrR family transcriptional regulator
MGERVGVGERRAILVSRGIAESRAPLFQKLKPGPGRAPEQVLANQRVRLHGAMIALVAESGYRQATVRGLSRLAGVSTKTFYECFANVEDCFVGTYARILRDALRCPVSLPDSPEQRLRARLRRFYAVLGSDQRAARLLLVDVASTDPDVAARTRSADRAFERLLGQYLIAGSHMTPFTAALSYGAVAAALQLARTHVLLNQSMPTAQVADHFADWLLSFRGASPDAMSSGADSRLQPDPSGAAVRSDIGDVRHFLMAAAIRLVVRDGYSQLTVPAIRREAGVSRRSFDERFDGVDDCFLTAIQTRVATITGRAESLAVDADNWENGVARLAVAIAAELRRDPNLARLVVTDVLAAGPEGLAVRERTLTRWSRRLRRTAPSDCRLGSLAAEASVTAASSIAAAGHLNPAGRTAQCIALLILAPAVGSDAAEKAIAAELNPPGRVEKHWGWTP